MGREKHTTAPSEQLAETQVIRKAVTRLGFFGARRYVGITACAALAICGFALLGGWLQVRLMTGFPWVTMQASTAVGLGSVALALMLISRRAERGQKWASSIAVVVVVVSLVSLLQYGGWSLVALDEVLVVDPWTEAAAGRPAPTTVIAMLALGVALGSHRARWRWPFHVGCWLVVSIAWFSLIGYLYSPRDLARVPGFETLSLATACCLSLLAAAVLLLRPDEGVLRLLLGTGAQTLVTRAFMPLGALTPVLMGLALLRWPDVDWLTRHTGLAAFSTVSLLCFVGLAFVTARKLELLEARREQDEAKLKDTLHATKAALARANAYLEAAPGAMLVVSSDGTIESANRQAELLFGYQAGELLTRTVHDLLPERFRQRHPELVEGFFVAGQSRELGDGGGLIALRKDGTETAVEIAVNPFDADGPPRVVCGLRDISARLEAEKARTRVNQRLRLATSAAGIGIWEWDIEGGCLIWNDEMKDIYGQTSETFTGTFEAWRDALLAEEREQVEAMLAGVLAGTRDPEFDFRIRRPTGEVRIIEMSCVVERNTDGAPVRLIGTNRDVTEERMAAAEQQLERRRFEGIFNSMFQMTWILSPEGKVLEANRTALELHGTTLADVKGKPFWETPWCPGGKTETDISRAIHRAALGRFNRFWTRVGPTPTETIPVDLSVKPVLSESGEVQMLVTEARDVSDAEAARAALIESESKFRNALDHSAIGLALVDLAGRFTRVNRALCRILDRSEAELLAVTFQDITHPEDIAADMALAGELLAGKRSHYHLEKRYLKKDGEVVWGLLTGSLVRTVAGEPQYFIAQIQDFTERRQADERIKKSLNEKEVLLREIHHRVKNNLQVVSSILRLARKKIDQPPLRAVFDETTARIQTMALVHEQLCRNDDLGAVNFAAQLEELCSLAQRTSRGDNQRVHITVEAEPQELDMDQAIPLGLIANELLSNALKHAFVDGRTGAVLVKLSRRGSDLELSVKDDGVGLPTGFDVTKTTSLGMRIVTRLTSQLRGRLSVTRGVGSEFVVRIGVTRTAPEMHLGAA